METTITIPTTSWIDCKRWSIIQYSAHENKSVIIRKKKNRIDCFPYQQQETILAQNIWWWLLKILVFLKFIK